MRKKGKAIYLGVRDGKRDRDRKKFFLPSFFTPVFVYNEKNF